MLNRIIYREIEIDREVTMSNSGAGTGMYRVKTSLSVVFLGGILVCLFAASANAAVFVSDDFSSANLNTQVWTIEDPVGDATYSLSAGELSISVSSGLDHNVWTSGNMSARVMQSTDDVDFELEVKFASIPVQKYQLQGVLIEQDDDNFLRFDFYSDGKRLKVFAASFVDGSPTVRTNSRINPSSGELFMRVTRVGDQWSQEYSFDGLNWTVAGDFSHQIAANRAGPFVGNAGSAPAFTGTIDYFFDTAAPIIPEDGSLSGPDTTPPNLFNIDLIPISDSEISVSWSTDEPSDGMVEWGLTTGYELGSLSNSALTNQHTFVIDDLQSENIYQIRFSSADVESNRSTSSNYSIDLSAIPTFDIWYGQNQTFGALGQPQRWVNVLGNVFDLDGLGSLGYSLNGQPTQSIAVGPDNKRLQDDGDFNVEIDFADLNPGFNTVDIVATDTLGLGSTERVFVDFSDPNAVWPASYSIDWSNVTNIQDVAQVVDGHWYLETNSVRPVAMGYDRLIAIGDVLWEDYEVTAALTVHGLDPYCDTNSCAGGHSLVGLLVRWPGHQDSGRQPNDKWFPMGSLSAYKWPGERLEIVRGSDGSSGGQDNGATFPFGVPHFFKMRAETVSGAHRYSAKFWPQTDDEPSGWSLTIDESLSETASGSVLLVAHHVDVSFGDVVVTPLSGGPPPVDTTSPVISNIQVTSITESAATITWQTDEASDSSVDYGLSSNYELGTVADAALTTSHSLTLTNLSAATEYHYRVGSSDASSNSAFSTDLTFTTMSSPPIDTTPPVISNIQVTSITESAATITWQTDEASDSSVDYGLSSNYELGTVADAALTTSHSLTLTNLSAATEYHYRVGSSDASSNSAFSTDLTFTTMSSPPIDTTPPVISNIQVTSITESAATITWQTDEASDSSVDYGLSSNYELGTVADAALTTSHSIVLSSLTEQTQYHYRVNSVDAAGNGSSSGDLVFTTDAAIPPPPGSISPDDFIGPLDTAVWTLNDPLGDSVVTTTGNQLEISVAPGNSHDVWTGRNYAPRLRQTVADTDFEIEIKFDTAVTAKYQLQGVLVEQDDGNFVRFDFYSTGSNTKGFAATFTNGSATAKANNTVPGAAPLYMRVKREGNAWTQSVSSDGVNWSINASFTHALQVNTIAIFAGNHHPSNPSPAHTALIDYFHVVSP